MALTCSGPRLWWFSRTWIASFWTLQSLSPSHDAMALTFSGLRLWYFPRVWTAVHQTDEFSSPSRPVIALIFSGLRLWWFWRAWTAACWTLQCSSPSCPAMVLTVSVIFRFFSDQITCWCPSILKIVIFKPQDILSFNQEDAHSMILAWMTGRDISDFRINIFISSMLLLRLWAGPSLKAPFLLLTVVAFL